MEQTEYAYAARFRDTVRKIVLSVLDDERPPDGFATVASVDLTKRLAYVTYAGEGSSVPVLLGSFVPPVGAVVRIKGPRSGRYVADTVKGFANEGQLVAYKMGTASGVNLNFNQVSNATPLHIFSTNMVAGRMYRLQFTFRAIQGNTGMYTKLQKGGADYPGPYDYYIGATTTPVGTWTSANIQWLIPGTGNSGVVGWRLQCWHLGTSGTGQVYNDSGGFAACYDLGPDPGAQ